MQFLLPFLPSATFQWATANDFGGDRDISLFSTCTIPQFIYVLHIYQFYEKSDKSDGSVPQVCLCKARSKWTPDDVD